MVISHLEHFCIKIKILKKGYDFDYLKVRSDLSTAESVLRLMVITLSMVLQRLQREREVILASSRSAEMAYTYKIIYRVCSISEAGRQQAIMGRHNKSYYTLSFITNYSIILSQLYYPLISLNFC